MKYVYTTHGTCSRQIEISVAEDGKTIDDVRFIGGCAGNTLGVSSLVKGRTLDEVISRLEGIPCGTKGTSCPDQLARALKEIQANG